MALPHLPGRAVENGRVWRPDKDVSYTWDESYTNSENLFLAFQRGAGERYRDLAVQYLDEEYFAPLAEGRPGLSQHHAYSYVNALSSAMQAYLTLGSERHLRAARNGFEQLAAQSFATGGWGPDETLRPPTSGEIAASLTNTHASFETPCGAYAHFKLTRYLLRVTGDTRYGDSMERVMYNTVLGAKPMHPDGNTFYYADCNVHGHKVYSEHRWPCCSGTFPQVATDYRLNSYFHDRSGLYVNLYIPSTVHWTFGGARVALTQQSHYPFDGLIRFDLSLSTLATFAIHLRVPAWADGAAIEVNGKRVTTGIAAGQFVQLLHHWRSNDRIELELPLRPRLESIDAQHPQIAALLRGPLVLFAIGASEPVVTRAQLLAAKRVSEQSWRVETSAAPMMMLPFTAIEDQQYSTYLETS